MRDGPRPASCSWWPQRAVDAVPRRLLAFASQGVDALCGIASAVWLCAVAPKLRQADSLSERA